MAQATPNKCLCPTCKYSEVDVDEDEAWEDSVDTYTCQLNLWEPCTSNECSMCKGITQCAEYKSEEDSND